MATEWFFAHDGQRHGPVSADQIREMAAGSRLRPDDLVWQTGMEDWLEARKVPGLLPPPSEPPPIVGREPSKAQPNGEAAAIQEAASNKVAAGICGILIGSLGVHKFIIGLTTPGLIMLMVTLLTCGLGGIVMHAIGLVEGIIYLTKSDRDFYETYIVEKKGWF